MTDADTGEILFHSAEKLEAFGGSRSMENRVANIFASFFRGLRCRESLSVTITTVPVEEELPIIGF